MKPIGPLMREHRLIERMVSLINEELRKIGELNRVDPDFIDVATDFFRTYADRTHHGKEEDILFRELAKKQLSPEHEAILKELTEEHVLARKTVGSLIDTKKSYTRGNTGALRDIAAGMRELVRLYPAHIKKEDKDFFYPCMEYFNRQEQDSLLQEFRDFDQKMIHERYQKVVEELTKGESQV